MIHDRMQGDVGPPVAVKATGFPLSAPATAFIKVIKPRGAGIVFWDAAIDTVNQLIVRVLQSGDLDVAGRYILIGTVLKDGMIYQTDESELNVGASPPLPGASGPPAELVGLRTFFDAIVGVSLNGGTKVAAAYDQSGNGMHPVQVGSEAKQPGLIVSPYNGRPGFAFVPTIVGGPQVLRIPNMSYLGATGITVGFVASDTSSEVSQVIFEGGVGGNANLWGVYANSPTTAGELEIRGSQLGDENGIRIIETLAAPRSIIFTIDRTLAGGVGSREVRVWVDGVEVVAPTQTQTGNLTGIFDDVALNIGARNDGSALGWLGIMHEVEVCLGILPDATIEDVLYPFHAGRWGV